VEASTSARIILAGLLLKFGTQGFYRFIKFIVFFNNFILIIISLFGVLLGSLICLFQRDVKSLIAFSSVVHISFLLFIFLNFVSFSKTSSFILIISHGLISTIIFYLVGEFVHFNLSRLIYFFNRIFINNRFLIIFLRIFLILNSGLPPNISFFSEILGFFVNFNFIILNFLFIGIFIFFGFLFNFFLIVNFRLGKYYINRNILSIFFCFGFLFISFNFLIFI
jgi:NADH:ubiquinone oxidoreductase subunit 4 (subunit M)